MQRLAGWLAILVCLVLLLSGCGGGETVIVGTNAQYPPFEMKDASGKLTGFDVELMKAIAKEAGLKVEIRHTGWDSLFRKVGNGEIDAAISAITITDQRKQEYDFSVPYFEAKQLILVPAGSPAKSLQELKGKRVGVQASTTSEAIVVKAFGRNEPGIKRYQDAPQAVKDLQAGRLDAVLADSGLILYWLKELGEENFKVLEDPSFPVEQYGIMVKKGNKELLDKVNAGLKKIREDGIYDQIFLEYFAPIETAPPPQ